MSFHFALLEIWGSADGILLVLVDYIFKSDNKKAVKDKALRGIV
jgi:hypothetical protein